MHKNKPSAVMAQRVEPRDSLDDFPTPPWAVRAFCEWLRPSPGTTVWEPAANRGYMVKGLEDYFSHVYASDVFDYGVGYQLDDFLLPGPPLYRPDWIITNPPFRLALEFVDRALGIASGGVAIIARSVWSESAVRYEALFNPKPPTWILQHVDRVPMVKGRYDPSASSATAYSWFVWDISKRDIETRFGWIPPSRQRLFRPGDEEVSR